RAVATRLASHPDDETRVQAAEVMQAMPADLRSALMSGDQARWLAGPIVLHRGCAAAVRNLVAHSAGTPSLGLLAGHTAEILVGIADALNGIALLVADPIRPVPLRHGFRLRVPDRLPALVNAGRAFIVVAAMALFWIVTAWPNGASAII